MTKNAEAVLTVDRDALLGALRQVADVVEARTTIPVLSNLKLIAAGDVLTVTGTDLDRWASVTVPATGAIDTTIPKDKLLAAVSSFGEGMLTLASAPGAVTVKQGRGTRKLATLAATDFPNPVVPETATQFTLPASALLRLLDTTQVAQSTEETRYYLCGVLLHVFDGELRAAATDGFRLVRAGMAAPDGAAGMPDSIVPSKTVGLLRRLGAKTDGEVTLEIGAGFVVARVGRATLHSKLIDGTFPDYSRVIPPPGKRRLRGMRDALTSAVDAVAAVIDAEGDRVKVRSVAIELRPDDASEVEASDTSGTAASEPLTVNYEGEPQRVGVNSRYFQQLAGIFADDAAVTIEIADPAAPMRWTSDKDPDLVAVLMPLRA